MELSIVDKILFSGLAIGLTFGIIYSKFKYGLPFFSF